MIEEHPNEARYAIVSQEEPTNCANCERPVSSRYKCKGCKLSMHWYCSEDHSTTTKKSKGLGPKYWCSYCYKKRTGKNSPILNSNIHINFCLIFMFLILHYDR